MLYTKNGSAYVGEIHEYPEDNYVEVLGRAEEFTSLVGPPFFRFSLKVGPVEYEVTGCDWTVFENKIISPEFLNTLVEWETQPFVKIFGRKSGDTHIVGYIIDVESAGELRNWYYKSFLSEDERSCLRVLSRYSEKNIWVKGVLTENDLLGLFVTPNFERFQVPDSYLGREAYVNGRILVAGGVGLTVENLFIKQGCTYVEVQAP